jgi:hypothetical protein
MSRMSSRFECRQGCSKKTHRTCDQADDVIETSSLEFADAVNPSGLRHVWKAHLFGRDLFDFDPIRCPVRLAIQQASLRCFTRTMNTTNRSASISQTTR